MGKKIHDAMTANPCAIDADKSVQHAAKMMRDEDVGFAPIVEGMRLIGALTDRDTVAGAEGQHVQLRLVAEREGEQPAVAGRLQHDDRLRAAALGGGAVAGPVLHPGQPAQVRPERALVAQRPAQLDRLRLDDRGLGGTDRVALDGVPL